MVGAILVEPPKIFLSRVTTVKIHSVTIMCLFKNIYDGKRKKLLLDASRNPDTLSSKY
jgi:hypothetical protein